jgi:hypothetical protein
MLNLTVQIGNKGSEMKLRLHSTVRLHVLHAVIAQRPNRKKYQQNISGPRAHG